MDRQLQVQPPRIEAEVQATLADRDRIQRRPFVRLTSCLAARGGRLASRE